MIRAKKIDTKMQKMLMERFKETRRKLPRMRVNIVVNGIDCHQYMPEERFFEIVNRAVNTLSNSSASSYQRKIKQLQNSLVVYGPGIMSEIQINIRKRLKIIDSMVESSELEGSIVFMSSSDDPKFPITLPMNHIQLAELLGHKFIDDEGKIRWTMLLSK